MASLHMYVFLENNISKSSQNWIWRLYRWRSPLACNTFYHNLLLSVNQELLTQFHAIRKSKDYVYGIWVSKVLGIWKGHYRFKKSLVSCMKPWTEARNNNRYMKWYNHICCRWAELMWTLISLNKHLIYVNRRSIFPINWRHTSDGSVQNIFRLPTKTISKRCIADLFVWGINWCNDQAGGKWSL